MKAQPCPRCGFLHQCVCGDIPQIESSLRFVLLQHPNEPARLSNSGKLLHWFGFKVEHMIWQRQTPPPQWQALVEDPALFPVLLYPHPQAQTLPQVQKSSAAQQRQSVFVILDGTWQEARKMLNKSEWLAQLPCLSISSRAESAYQLRRNQQPGNLCTMEIAAELLAQSGELAQAQQMQQFLQHYLQVFHADRSGHSLK